jgi:serine/threonine-protein kinase PpkA
LLFREDGTLVLTDFGSERDLSDNPRLTTAKSLVGDLRYVSPESIRHGSVDVRSDLYSAGVVLYEMLTGTTPFGNTTVTATLEALLGAPIPRLPPSSAALQPLVDGLLAKDPSERFQSADDVLDGIAWTCPAGA